MTEKKTAFPLRAMVTTALMAAILCILCPFSLPIGPVPISLGTFAVALVTYIAGWKLGSLSVLLYLLLGLVGLPVFSGFTGGAAKLLGPTGGYLIGYLPMAVLAGLIIDRFPGTGLKDRVISFLGLCLGTAVLYLLGTLWLAYQAHYTFLEALSLGVLPFIFFDLVKLLIVTLLAPMIRKRIRPREKTID